MSTEPALRARTREYEFTTRDFEHVRKLIYQHAGISLASSKQDMVYSRLARRLREKGLTRFEDYLRTLKDDNAAEREQFINSLTTNLTSFYRESHHFPILAEHLRARYRRTREPLAIWCCAASTGEEPYTIAMTAIEALGDTPPVRILATDVDTEVLARADAGVYDSERIESIATERKRRFFVRGEGRRTGYVKVKPEVRKLITFRQQNLLDGQWPMRGPFDVIFCRNVMIYFDRETQRRILEKAAPLMRDDGLLFAGHSESFLFASDLIRLRGKTVYERALEAK